MADPAISDELIAKHGLNKSEYHLILNLIGRSPTYTELGILSAMWNEHCSYKSSKKWLRTPVSYTHLRAHETDSYLVCRLLLEKK